MPIDGWPIVARPSRRRSQGRRDPAGCGAAGVPLGRRPAEDPGQGRPADRRRWRPPRREGRFHGRARHERFEPPGGLKQQNRCVAPGNGCPTRPARGAAPRGHAARSSTASASAWASRPSAVSNAPACRCARAAARAHKARRPGSAVSVTDRWKKAAEAASPARAPILAAACSSAAATYSPSQSRWPRQPGATPGAPDQPQGIGRRGEHQVGGPAILRRIRAASAADRPRG